MVDDGKDGKAVYRFSLINISCISSTSRVWPVEPRTWSNYWLSLTFNHNVFSIYFYTDKPIIVILVKKTPIYFAVNLNKYRRLRWKWM